MEAGIKISSTTAYSETVIRQAYDELNAAQEAWYANEEDSGEENGTSEEDNAGVSEEEDNGEEDDTDEDDRHDG